MALLFMDSFDHYQTADITEKWTQLCALESVGTLVPTVVGAYGRNGSQGVRFSADATNEVATPLGLTVAPSGATCLVGAAVRYSAFNNIGVQDDPEIKQWAPSINGGNWLCAIRDTNTYQVFFVVNTNGTISCYRGDTNGATLLGTTSLALQTGVYHYVEMKVLIDPSAGTVDVRVDGASGLSLTGQNTRTSANSAWNEVRLGFFTPSTPNLITLDIDDVVVMDGSGSFNNAFIGDVSISAIYPNGVGNSSGWTPSAGSNYENVDEALVNDDTDYNSSSTVNAKDTYAFPSAPSGADIRAVQIVSAQRKGAEGPGKIKHVVRSSGTDYDQTEQGIGGTTYSFLRTVLETDPATAAAWSESGFNAAEFGIKKVG